VRTLAPPDAGILELPPFENRNGVATSSSPWETAREGNEDVAAPGAVSTGARGVAAAN